MARTKDEAVRELATWHFGIEPDLKQVIRIVGDNEDKPGEPIKLLEVNAATVATGCSLIVRTSFWNSSAMSACVSQSVSPSKRHSMRVRPSSVW
jgi:hypothetical protein